MEKELKIGSKFRGKDRKTYTVVSIFDDAGKTFYVCKCPICPASGTSSYTYSNVFCYNKRGELFRRI
jgi:hypothetical protein